MSYLLRNFICLECNKNFSIKANPNRMFCSIACRQKYRNDVVRNPSKSLDAKQKISKFRKGKPTSLGIPCPEEKKRKISASLLGRPTGRRPHPNSIKAFIEGMRKAPRLKGSKHPNWKGGLTSERQKDYRSNDYRKFVNIVLQRDNYTCQNCGARNGLGEKIKLQVHHIIPYGERPDLRYVANNGLTLCFPCHNLTKKIKPPLSVGFKPKEKICETCHKSFKIPNSRKYCPLCRKKYCCPICGSTKCNHWQRKSYCSQIPQFIDNQLSFAITQIVS